MILTKDIKNILNIFEKKGYKAYIVGGAIRDYLLGNKIKDYDITTDAEPEEVMNLFSNVIPTGIEFGTVTVIFNDNNYEITTFRKDIGYKDNRKPQKVLYAKEIEEDLKRRDFTINSLYCDSNEKIYDFFNGKKDIKNKTVKTIGSPDKRFKEDALRMIRGVRFVSTLNFEFDKETKDSINRNYKLLGNISKERIKEEFDKIILSDRPDVGINLLVETNLMKFIIPEIYKTIGFEQYNKYHDKDVYNHILTVVKNIEPKLTLRLAALFHDIEKPNSFTLDKKGVGHFKGHHILSAEKSIKILKRLKYDNKTIKDVETLIRNHYLKDVFIKEKGVKRFINNVGKDRIEDVFKLNIADIKGKTKETDIEKVYNLQKKCEEIINKKEPLSVKDLKINGNDLKRINIKEGKIIGEILTYLLEKVLEEPEFNNYDNLMVEAKKYLKKRN